MDQLAYDYVLISDALGESYPLNFEAAADLMDKKFPGIFFIKSDTNEKGGGAKKITINLDDLHSLSGKLHAEKYGGAIEPYTELTKTVIAMQEISPDDELRINLEKSLATSEKGMTARTSSSTTNTEESGRKKPLEKSNSAAKPSSTNKPNVRNDDYSIGDASNYDGEYFPGFRE